MLEAEVHFELKSLLRKKNQPSWIHHLTMARLVARGLRMGKSALIQTGVERQKYYLSYLAPALLSQNSVILVANNFIQKQLLTREIPQLQKALNTHKLIGTYEDVKFIKKQPYLILISPQEWLNLCFNDEQFILNNIPIIIEEADKLEEEISSFFTIEITPEKWFNLQQEFSTNKELIRDSLIKLTLQIFAHPENPYQSHLLEQEEKDILVNLFNNLSQEKKLDHELQLWIDYCQEKNRIIYAKINRKKGKFTLIASPLIIVNEQIKKLWSSQTILFISTYLEQDKNSTLYCDSLGIENKNLTTLKFTNDSQNNLLKLYLPKKMPLPNTPSFKNASLEEIIALIEVTNQTKKPIIVLTNDVPLKAQFASYLAAQFGSRVTLENKKLLHFPNNIILVCGWSFWQENQYNLSPPQLIISATLPIPSLENPLIASKVSFYKSQGKDWFRSYLLPVAIKEMQISLTSIRNEKSVFAILDNRVNVRSYGNLILKALEPFAKINYLDSTWFFYN